MVLYPAARAALAENTLLLPTGGHFVGEFDAEFKPHGKGAEYRADSSELASGQWRDGKLHGRGNETYDNGRYEGEFEAGKRSGTGVYSFVDGTLFEGQYADKRSGFGVMWKQGKLTCCGCWSDDKLAESRPVPRSKIPVGALLSAVGESRATRVAGQRREPAAATLRQGCDAGPCLAVALMMRCRFICLPWQPVPPTLIARCCCLAVATLSASSTRSSGRMGQAPATAAMEQSARVASGATASSTGVARSS